MAKHLARVVVLFQILLVHLPPSFYCLYTMPPRPKLVDIFQNSGPHSGQIRAFSLAPDGRRLLSSSEGLSRNLLLLTDTRHGHDRGTVDTGDVLATSVAWGTGDQFFLGTHTGDLYMGRVQGGAVSGASGLHLFSMLTFFVSISCA